MQDSTDCEVKKGQLLLSTSCKLSNLGTIKAIIAQGQWELFFQTIKQVKAFFKADLELKMLHGNICCSCFLVAGWGWGTTLCGLQDLRSQARDWTRAPTEKALSPNNWRAREFSRCCSYNTSGYSWYRIRVNLTLLYLLFFFNFNFILYCVVREENPKAKSGLGHIYFVSLLTDNFDYHKMMEIKKAVPQRDLNVVSV